MTSIIELYVFVLAAFVGYQVITRVPPLLHTPLMSATNAISAISLVGSLVLAGANRDTLSNWLGFIAVTAATINVVGGFLITDRMLKMFRRDRSPRPARRWRRRPEEPAMNARELVIQAIYLASSVLFILGLKSLSHPDRARMGMQQAAMGMALAIIGTLFHHEIVRFDFIALALILGTVIGYPLGMFVPMTAMPQRIAISHMFGALAATLVGVAEYRINEHGLPRSTMAALGFEVLFGALTVTGSFMAFGKLQEFITGRPVTYRGQNAVNITLFGVAIAMFGYLIYRPETSVRVLRADRPGPAPRRLPGAAHRRGRHAGGGVAPQLLRRPGVERDRVRDPEQRPHHLRRPGRSVGLPPLHPDVQGDEPELRQRALRRLRGAARARGRDAGQGSRP